MGQALGEECIALKVDVLLGPGNNMKRSPLGGRNFEYFSEDPYLAGEMAASLINGVQSKGVGTSLKHFAANNQEYQRFSISAEVDERTLREIYLPAFETAVKKAQALDGDVRLQQAQRHLLLREPRAAGGYSQEGMGFRRAWSFPIGARCTTGWHPLKGGLDLEMPGPRTAARPGRGRGGALRRAGRGRAG